MSSGTNPYDPANYPGSVTPTEPVGNEGSGGVDVSEPQEAAASTEPGSGGGNPVQLNVCSADGVDGAGCVPGLPPIGAGADIDLMLSTSDG